MKVKQFIPVCLGIGAVLLAGCASSGVKNPSGVPVTEMRADERGFVAGTGVESQDIVTVADKMARGLLSLPEIANAPQVPRIHVLPVENNTRFAFNKEIFIDEIRSLLNERAANKVRFLARDRMPDIEKERELKRSGAVTASSDPSVNRFRGADLFLTGKLSSHTTRTSAGVSDYVLYTFQLIDPNTTEVIWEGSHRIKKQGLEDAAYR